MTGSQDPSPQTGDIVIGRDLTTRSLYTLTVWPGEPQVRYPDFQAALAAATEWALKADAGLWLAEDGKGVTPLQPTGTKR